ncbi:MAG: hypothetical protein KF789_07965 [Bdellovibrionaceae bacterium]|nr:hypothetical protein [Pseudobdellovibrionaceae bacterium]
MRFNRNLLLIGLASVVGFSGCSRFLNEDRRKDQVIELSDEKFRCLEDWPAVIRDFTEGNAAERQIRPAFRCLSNALTYFQENTKGSMPEAYTEKDLRDFFGRYFLKQTNIPPALAQGFLRLKQVLFGGSDQFVTKSELIRVVGFLQPLEDQAVLLAPYVRVYTTQEMTAVDAQRIDVAIHQLRSSLQNLMHQVELVRSDYNFDEAQDFLSLLADFVRGASAPVDTFDLISEWLPVIQSVKQVFFGDRASLRGTREWTEALNTVIDLYDLGLRYHYIMSAGLFDTPERMTTALKSGDKLLSLLENSHQMRSTGRLPFRYLDEVIDQVLVRKLINQPLSANTIKGLYRKVVIGMMDPVRRGDTRGADAIEQVHLVSIRREFNIFRLNQVFFDSLGERPVGHRTLQVEARRFDAKAAIRKLVKDPIEEEALLAAWTKFRSLVTKDRPAVFDTGGRVQVQGDVSTLTWVWKARARFNVMHLLTRGFMLGYGDSGDPSTAHCNEQSLIRWYADFTDFGAELKAFDPRAENSGARSFREASFFTFSGDGNDRVNMDEMFEFISLLFSAGLENANTLREHMDDPTTDAYSLGYSGVVCKTDRPDVFGLPMLNEVCFKNELRRTFGKAFVNLPGLVTYVKGLNDAQWDEFYLHLMAAAKSSYSLADLVDTSDLRTAVMILHYMEVLFTTYDANVDAILSREELLAAAPRFIPFLRELSPVKSDKFVTEAFLDLVYKGERPGAWSMTQHGAGRLWGWVSGSSGSTADRLNILRVFGNLKAELEAGTVSTP